MTVAYTEEKLISRLSRGHKNFKNKRNRDYVQKIRNRPTLQNNKRKWNYSKNTLEPNKIQNKAHTSDTKFCEISTQAK